MVQTLIANSGIQFFSREILLDANDGFRQVFYEWFDEKQVEQVLEYAYEIRQLEKFVHYSDMLKYGFVDPQGNLLVEPDVVDANPEVRVIHKGDIDLCPNLFRMRLGDKNNCTLSKYLNVWLPAPYYEIDRSGKFRTGPYNWCRFKVCPVSEENGRIRASVLFAVDTHTAYSAGDDYNECPVFIGNSESEKRFQFCADADKMIDFCTGRNDWIRTYLMKLVHGTDDINKIPPQVRYKYSFLASYYMLLSYVAKNVDLPQVKLIRDRGIGEINVEMIIDIGNSRTSAILFEDADFKKVQSLKLQDFTRPMLPDGSLNRIGDTFDMRLAFSKVEFGGNLDGSTQFTWPSIVRLGKEAEYLTHEATNMAIGKQTLSTYSSPKRYLWDYRPRPEEWRFVNLGDGVDRPPILKGITDYFGYDGRLDKDGFGTGANYSRRTLMTFAFLEILAQAISQVNSHEYREFNGNINTPRRINRIVLTCPTAMSKFEQKSLHSSLEDAIFVIDRFNNNVDSTAVPLGISVEPSLKRDSDDNSPWIFDEATCSQFVYLYSVLATRYRNNSKDFFDIYGKRRMIDGEPRDSIVIGSVDIGAGTSDVTICRYERNDRKSARLRPMPVFWDSFDYAGDDMLRVLINNVLLEGEDGMLQKYLSAKGMGRQDIYARLFDFFGEDHNKLSFRDRSIRRDFNIQVLVPIMYYFLDLMGRGEKYREVGFNEIFAGSMPSEVVEEAFNEKFGISLRDIKWKYDADVMTRHIENAMDPLIENVATIMYAYDCDLILLSGRPTSLKVIRDIFLKYFAVAPDRLIAMTDFRIGHWYPFADRNGYLKDSKSIVPVGAMIAWQASHAGGFNGFLLDLKDLGNRISPTTEYFARMNATRRNGQWFISPEVGNGEFTAGSFPTYIGSKQFDIANYPLRPFYVFDIDEANITARVRHKKAEEGIDLTQQELQVLIKAEKERILSRCPLTVKVSREDYRENKERLTLENVVGDDGEELNVKDFKFEIQSLNDPDCYWLDSGEFNINIIANNKEIYGQDENNDR